jgi:hypothetical protein
LSGGERLHGNRLDAQQKIAKKSPIRELYAENVINALFSGFFEKFCPFLAIFGKKKAIFVV